MIKRILNLNDHSLDTITEFKYNSPFCVKKVIGPELKVMRILNINIIFLLQYAIVYKER